MRGSRRSRPATPCAAAFTAIRQNWDEFVAAYHRELAQEPAKTAAAELRKKVKHEPVTLLYAARDETHNNAIALRECLERPD